MNYIVLDLEWNQSEDKSKENKKIPFEIIEIGAIKLDSKRNVIGEFSQLIKPEIYSNMNHFTENLIHLQMEELERGKPFVKVMGDFLSWCGKGEFLFCTWGPLDLLELQRNMRYYGMKTFSHKPFPYLDIQKLFSIQFEDGKQRRTLEYAIDFLEIEKDIPFHRAFSDAYYTSKILSKLTDKVMKRQSYDVFNLPTGRKDEIHFVFDTYYKYISRKFKSKHLTMSDREVCSTRCYYCNRGAKKVIRWFSHNNKHYYSISYCPEHGYMKGKIRLRRSDDYKYYAIKTLKLIKTEEYERFVGKIKERDKQ